MTNRWLSVRLCELFHGGGTIERDDHGRLNWQCASCGRWSNAPVSLKEEERMTARAMAQRWRGLDAAPRRK